MKTVVISLGGSIIVPNNVDYNYLDAFKKTINKFKNYKFIIVTGGGYTARKYITALKEEKLNEKVYSWIGIAVTKLNAKLVAGFFNKVEEIPDSLSEVKKLLNKNKIIVCGALGFTPKMTSDGTTADIARTLKAEFINITDVKGLYNKDPKKHKNAKFIPRINFNDFYKMAMRIHYKPGQHFVLDQHASKIIKKYKIKTYIINKNLKNLENLLKNKKFIGTTID